MTLAHVVARLDAIEHKLDAALAAARPREAIRSPRFSSGRRPKFSSDPEVRDVVLARHRQMTVKQLCALIAEEFGEARVPSATAIATVCKAMDRARKGGA
jgi:hypothetical protein